MAPRRTPFRLALLVATSVVVLCRPAFGQPPQYDPLQRPDDNVGIAVDQVGVLVYPANMTYNAIYSGEVQAVIAVDEKGKLTDCLITAYTERDFANAARLALNRWKYQPARADGRPVAGRANVVFTFQDQGVIVQTFPGAIIKHAFFSGIAPHLEYRAYQLRDLDRIPTPVHVVSPASPAGGGPHTVTVEFYIDEEGRVRLPAVDRSAASDLFAAAAVAAVEQWRFEPPRRKGNPVLVAVQQEFKLQAKP